MQTYCVQFIPCILKKGMDSDSVNEEIGHLQALITDEEEKMQQYKLEVLCL